MSGLLVKSTLIMRENLELMNDRGLTHMPVLLGGAALTRTYVERDLREVYDGRVFYGKDAFEGLRTMDRLVRAEASPARTTRSSDGRSPRRTCPDAAARRRPPTGPGGAAAAPGPDVATDNPLFAPPSSAAESPRACRSTRSREYLNLTALFRNQWGFRPENGEDDPAFKERVRATLREQLGKAKEEDLLVPQVVWGHFPPTPRATTSSSAKDETQPTEWLRFTFPRQRKEPWLCIADFFRPSDSGDQDYASFMLVHHGRKGVGARRPELFARTATPTTSCCTASASRWPRRWPSIGTGASARSWASPNEDGPTLTGLFRQQYRGGRYSWGYPACPDLTDNAKVVELLEASRIGVTVARRVPAPPRADDRRHHLPPPEAKYFVA